MNSKSLLIILAAVCGLLLVPFIAMFFTTEVQWDLTDFLVMGFMLFGSGVLLELARINIPQLRYKIAAIGFVILCFLLIWAELAVGVFGTPFAGS
jgi:hypothetical protein